MEPAELLPYFQLVGQVALVVGALFAGYQLLRFEQGRKQAAAVQVLQNIQSPDFRAAYAHVYELPIGAPAETIRKSKDLEEAATTIMMAFETLGVMVHNRIVPIEVVDQVIGGFLRESWRRLEPYTRWKRKELGAPRWGEWYQWLYEHLSSNPRRAEGAYEAFKEWRPDRIRLRR
jgi:hypothetical protein